MRPSLAYIAFGAAAVSAAAVDMPKRDGNHVRSWWTDPEIPGEIQSDDGAARSAVEREEPDEMSKPERANNADIFVERAPSEEYEPASAYPPERRAFKHEHGGDDDSGTVAFKPDTWEIDEADDASTMGKRAPVSAEKGVHPDEDSDVLIKRQVSHPPPPSTGGKRAGAMARRAPVFV